MKRMFTLAALLAVTASSSASAATPGGNLAWTDCHVDGGASLKDFSCGANTGYEVLVGSWVQGRDNPAVEWVESFVDVYFDDATLPDWWNTTACPGRTIATVGLDEPASLDQCVSTWSSAPMPMAVLFAYNTPIYITHNVITPGAANTAQLDLGCLTGRAGATVPMLADGREYFLFQLRFSHAKAVGTGSCTGCTAPGQINFQGAWFGAGTSPMIEDYAQGDQPTIAFNRRNVTVPTVAHSWGALKAMYR